MARPPRNLRSWLRTHLSNRQIRALAKEARFECLSSSLCDLVYARYRHEIWQFLRAETALLGLRSPLELVARISERSEDVERAENLLVRYAVSKIAVEIADEPPQRGSHPEEAVPLPPVSTTPLPTPLPYQHEGRKWLTQAHLDGLFWALVSTAVGAISYALVVISRLPS
jgi:hypothetical protein